MIVFLQFKLGICSVFWLGYLCVPYQCIYSDFLRRVRAHQCSSCPGCSFGWRQDLTHFFNLLFFFLVFLDRSDAIVKSLQVGSKLSGHPALPWEADPETGSIPSGNFSWSSGSNHWFCLASCSFSSYSSKFSFSKYFLIWQRYIQIWRQRAQTQQPYSAVRICHGLHTDEKCPVFQYILDDNYFKSGIWR